jgi:hypothetical protein
LAASSRRTFSICPTIIGVLGGYFARNAAAVACCAAQAAEQWAQTIAKLEKMPCDVPVQEAAGQP